MKEFYVRIGDVVFFFDSERDLDVEPELKRFLLREEAKPDVKVAVLWNYEDARKPGTSMKGQDLIQTYYIEGDISFCQTEGGAKGPVGLVVYSSASNDLECYINEAPYKQRNYSLGWILRLLPMREIFQRFGVLFFHAAQIAVGTSGILFTAPSETGKSTQAALWGKHEQARLLCGDRTLIGKKNDVWKCYGYPIDGSSPVRSTEVTDLKAVVILAQAEENRVERLIGAKGAVLLMPQLIIDGWSAEARQRAVERLLELQEEVAIYRLFCTPEKEAVDVLKKQLIEDGMI